MGILGIFPPGRTGDRVMRFRRLRTARLLVYLVLTLVLAGILAVKVVGIVATKKAEGIAATLMARTHEETVINIARWSADTFQVGATSRWYRRYAFLLSHRHMPGFLRIPRGATDILLMDGLCSNLSAVLELMFSAAGLEAVQHDLIGPMSGHSAISVKVDGEWKYIDPFANLMFAEEGHLISLERLKAHVAAGADPHAFAVKIGNREPSLSVYELLDRTSHARSGDPLHTVITFPMSEGIIRLGKIDGDASDVAHEGGGKELTTHLNYLGPRYNRNFTFQLRGEMHGLLTPLKIVYYLTEEVDPDNLPKANVEPVVSQRSLIYTVADPEAGLHLDFSEMRWTIRNLLRQKSWYDVDMIEVLPLRTREQATEIGTTR